MNQEVLFNQIDESAQTIEIIWSTLEAVYDALQDENAVADTYYAAIRGAADHAYRVKNCLAEILTDINR